MTLPLNRLLAALERIAPLDLAESWDNVGLLIDPRQRGVELDVESVVLTIDATPEVIDEVVARRSQCLVAYHPPLFREKRRYRRATDPVLFAAAACGFAVYSPHTALDSAPGGINDWLAACLGATAAEISPLSAIRRRDPGELKLVVFVPETHADALRDALSEAGAGVIGAYSKCSFGLRGEGTFLGDDSTSPTVGEKGRFERAAELRLEMVCPERALPAVTRALAKVHPYEEPAWDVYTLADKPVSGAGVGRRVEFREPRPLGELVGLLKKNLELPTLRLAESSIHAAGVPIRTVSVAAGSGSGVFTGSPPSDLYLTGEMRHHDVLETLARGASAVLCEHSSSERGYLQRLRARLLAETDGAVGVTIAEKDREPLRVV
jgi:dinuclear metal center YbgI/SA1388 family protein